MLRSLCSMSVTLWEFSSLLVWDWRIKVKSKSRKILQNDYVGFTVLGLKVLTFRFIQKFKNIILISQKLRIILHQ